ncbi:MAG: peptidoglycan-binding protein [Oscillospiraceae bacterium]|nr:peptidoglycan-binding protein [Oscillospiraceae bacterium]
METQEEKPSELLQPFSKTLGFEQEIRNAQLWLELLKERYLFAYTPGIYCIYTQEAVRKFQRDYDLAVTGELDSFTYLTLHNEWLKGVLYVGSYETPKILYDRERERLNEKIRELFGAEYTAAEREFEEWTDEMVEAEGEVDVEDEGSGGMTVSDEGVDMIAEFELSPGTMWARGLGEYDSQGKPIGIYPHYVFKGENNRFISDGGITFGYGHHITQDSYNKDENHAKAIVDKYAPKAVFIPSQILSNGSSYRVPGSSYMPMDEARALLEKDLKKAEDAVHTFLNKHKITLPQNQFDVLVSFTHQYGVNWWTRTPEREMPKFIRKGKGVYLPEDVEKIFWEHWKVDSDPNKARREKEKEVFLYGYQTK